MAEVREHPVAELLLNHVPRDLIMGIEDALVAGAKRGYDATKQIRDGHRATALGQMRHIHMNEAFSDALEAAGASPTPIRGNAVVVGKAGIFTLSRFNISAGIWYNGRRSRTRRAMAYANRAIEPLVQPGLFETPGLFGNTSDISAGTAFFVACFSGSLKQQPDAPLSVDIAVPDPEMIGWLFREPLAVFAKRYEVVVQQLDAAVPVLKSGMLQRREGT